MLSKLFLITFSTFAISNSFAQMLPKVSSGTIKRYENFNSEYVSARNIDVWLPDGYSSNKKYAVLYMHDGQMLFDSTTTWNHKAWNVAETMDSLIQHKKIMPCIVVGIWNSGAGRHADYFPQKPFESLPQNVQDTLYDTKRFTGASVFNGQKIHSDSYLKFIVQEVKPFIDSNYSTYTDRKHTFIMGSSMGGLISMYAICEYPEVFGGAGCLSTHWPGIFTDYNNPVPDAFFNYLEKHLPNSKTHKIYFDYGDQTLDAMYPALQKRVNEIMQQKGFNSKRWITKYFPGDDHSESCWAKRLHYSLEFLLKL